MKRCASGYIKNKACDEETAEICDRNVRRAFRLLNGCFFDDVNKKFDMPPDSRLIDELGLKTTKDYKLEMEAQRTTKSSSCITEPEVMSIRERNMFILKELAEKAVVSEFVHQTSLKNYATEVVVNKPNSGVRKELILRDDVMQKLMKKYSSRKASNTKMRSRVFAVPTNLKSVSTLPDAAPITRYSWVNENGRTILKGFMSQCDAWIDGGAGLCDPCLAKIWRHGKGTVFIDLMNRKCEFLK